MSKTNYPFINYDHFVTKRCQCGLVDGDHGLEIRRWDIDSNVIKSPVTCMCQRLTTNHSDHKAYHQCQRLSYRRHLRGICWEYEGPGHKFLEYRAYSGPRT
jgi:hypothetical protein